MKKLYIILSFTLLMLGCDRGFDDMNVNPVQPISINPVFLMNNAIILASHSGNILPYELAIVQQIVTPNTGLVAGANFNQDNRAVTLGIWQKYFRDVLKHTADVKNYTREDETRANLYHMARIWHSMAAMILTDTYGEIPYFSAGLSYLEDVVSPEYNTQEEIYRDILNELEEASLALSADNPIENDEVLYGGDIDKWKRLGNSLMLRAALRLIKVDEATAREYTAKAVAGGVMQSNADNAIIRHDFNYTNAVGNTLNATEANNYYLTAPFVNYLQANNDPRLRSIAVRYVGADSGPQQTAERADTSPEVQLGMPMGYDNSTIQGVVRDLGLISFYEFSQADRTRMAARDAPVFLVSYSQTLLLLADAVARGFIEGDAATYYAQGIRANMEQLAEYGSDVAVPEADIQAYLQAHPLDPANALEEINTQYWVASFLHGSEAFANFRRSGFPALTPNPYPGSEIRGDFIRRLTYPDAESSVNSVNFQEAIRRQGADVLDTRVWWDRE